MTERDIHGARLGWDTKTLNNMRVLVFHLRGHMYHAQMRPIYEMPYCPIPADLIFFNQLKHVYPNFSECSLRKIAELMSIPGSPAKQKKIYELIIKNIHTSLYGFDRLVQRYQDISSDSLIKIVQFIFDDYMRRRGGVDIENSNKDILEKIYEELYQANISEVSLKNFSALIDRMAKPSYTEEDYAKFREECLKIKNRAFVLNLDWPGPTLLVGATLAVAQVILLILLLYFNITSNFEYGFLHNDLGAPLLFIRTVGAMFYMLVLDFDLDIL